MKLSAAEVTIIRTIRRTAGGIPQTGAFLILAYGTTRAGRVFSQVRTGLTIVVHGRCSRQAGLCSGFTAHGAAIHKSVTGIGFDFVMFLSITTHNRREHWYNHIQHRCCSRCRKYCRKNICHRLIVVRRRIHQHNRGSIPDRHVQCLFHMRRIFRRKLHRRRNTELRR